MIKIDISKLDKNLASYEIENAEVTWISSHDEHFSLHGVFYNEEKKLYMRVPDEVSQASGNPAIGSLARMTSGGRLRFVTNSKFIAIKAALTPCLPMPHMSLTGSHGFSVYADGFYRNRYSPVFKDMIEIKGDLDKEKIIFAEKKDIADTNKNRVVEIYFPLYGGVFELYIGVEPGSTLEKAPPYSGTKPLLFYGSSITQGACVSRPGNDYVSIVARRLDFDYINLGFSGNGNAEDAMIDYITSIDASLYAFDYNMSLRIKDRVLPSHFSIYERIRNKHPDALILLYDKPGCDYECYPERENIICSTYEKALALGDKRICYIPSKELLGDGERDCCMTDIAHPNDLGAMRMADAIYSAINKMLKKTLA